MQNQTITQLLLLLLASFIFTSTADTIEYYIDPTGSDSAGDGSENAPFQSLSGAFNAYNNGGSSSSELYIHVNPGSYSGSSNVGIPYPSTNLVISGVTENSTDVVFQCDDITAYAFSPNFGSFELSYLSISNCQTGVYIKYETVDSNQNVGIAHVVFQTQTQNSIILLNPTSVSITNSTFTAISSLDQSYASISVNGAYLGGIDVLHNTFTACSGVYINNMKGGNVGNNVFVDMMGDSEAAPAALYITGGVFDLVGNTFTNVVSNYDNSPIYFENNGNTADTDSFSLENNEFTNCSSQWSGGAIEFFKVLGQISNSQFVDNSALRSGGAVYVFNSNVTIESSSFTGNVAQNFGGGAIDVEGDSLLFLNDNTFSNNVANNTQNSLACCLFTDAEGDCNANVTAYDQSKYDYLDIAVCSTLTYVSTEEYLGSLPSYPYQPGNDPSGSSSLWWLWLLIATFTIASVIVIGVLVGVAVAYKKNLIFKRDYEAYT